MKSVLIAVVFAFSSVASASTIAVTGGGRPGGDFSVIGNNFQAGSGNAGIGTLFGYCALAAPCAINRTAGIGPTGPGAFAMFNGQPDLSSGLLSSGVEGYLSVDGFVNIPANPLHGAFTGPVSVGGTLTGVLYPPAVVPFFEAQVQGTGTATLVTSEVLSDCSNVGISGPCAFMIDPTFQFSGTADVTPISGSEVPEPSSLLLVAGALAFGISWRGRSSRL